MGKRLNFIKYSLTFKYIVVTLAAFATFAIGSFREGKSVDFFTPAVMWFNHVISLIPFPSGFDKPEFWVWLVTNYVSFFGAIFGLVVIKRYINKGQFQKQDVKAVIIVIVLTIFSIAVVCRYIAIFLNPSPTYWPPGSRYFSTGTGYLAFNAYDNMIAITMLLQIAQASINTGLKRVFKRQVSA
jgi:hypothetical protein